MIAVIGAGIAGLACAAALEAAGQHVAIFDKGRVPGGRIATRQVDGMAFDHGAQFATARSPGLVALLARLQAEGAAAPWPAATGDGETRWIGTPAMASLPGALAGLLRAPVALRRQASFLHRSEHGWMVRHHAADQIAPGAVTNIGGTVDGPFAAVLLALPAPQAAALLDTLPAGSAGPGFAARCRATRTAPCWAGMVAFAERVAAAEAQTLSDDPVLGWIAREASRPGRAPAPDRWVLHGTAAWSRSVLEHKREAVARELLAAFRALTGTEAMPLHLSAQRWRHAKVEVALGEPCLFDTDSSLGACGDWCLGGRIEAAWQSGEALAARVLGGT